MKILHITNHLNVGGITTYVFTLGTGLKERGHKFFVASGTGELIPKFKDAGIEYKFIPMNTKKEISPKILFSFFKLKDFIKENNIDLIHTHTRTTQVLGSLLQMACKKPHVFTCHGFFKRRLLRKIFPCWGDKIIAISEQVKEHLIKDFEVDPSQIAVINNGIDLNRFICTKAQSSPEAKRSLGLSDGPVIGIVARLSDVKGHIYLIEAMKAVLESFPQAQLLIVGEGKEETKLKKKVGEIKISNNVFFVPRAPDTKVVLSATDIFVMPSLKEGLGLALMEAMASGLGVIGTDVGGIKSLVLDEINGLLVRPKDAQGIASAVIRLLNSPEERVRLGEAARKFIMDNFSVTKMAEETERVYTQCLKS